jgi:hypothetical protein
VCVFSSYSHHLRHQEQHILTLKQNLDWAPFKVILIDEILYLCIATSCYRSLSKTLYYRQRITQISTPPLKTKDRSSRGYSCANHNSSDQGNRQQLKFRTTNHYTFSLRLSRSRINAVSGPRHSLRATAATLIHLPHSNASFTEIEGP